MKVVFRADASIVIGSGHVVRCSTLAHQLQQSGVDTIFLCRDLEGNYCDWLESRNLPVMKLGTGHDRAGYAVSTGKVSSRPTMDQEIRDCVEILDALYRVDWVVVDHYALDARWESAVRRQGRNIMVIDDLANRHHECDLLVDQNLLEQGRYERFVPATCRQLIGPTYALLRPQFAAARERLPSRTGHVSRLLVFFGGADANADTLKVLTAIRKIDRPDLAVDVVIGQANPHHEAIKSTSRDIPNTQLYCQVDDMARLMADADLFIGSGGTSSWERCCLGLPSLVMAVADNQIEQSIALARVGAQIYLGRSDCISQAALVAAIVTAIDSPTQLREMSRSALMLVDGRGAERVVATMIQ